MKTKEFIQSLRKLIREEVRAAVREELKSVIVESNRQPIMKQQTQPQPQQKKQPIKYNTGNPLLDEVLSETIVPRGFGGESGPMVSDYEDFGFTTNSIPSPSMDAMMSQEDALPQTSIYNDPTMAFVKDYSAVLKKSEQLSK